jgi:hypothetical protein
VVVLGPPLHRARPSDPYEWASRPGLSIAARMLSRHSRVVRTCQASSDRLAAVVAAVTAALRRSSTVCFSGHLGGTPRLSVARVLNLSGEARKCLYLIFSSAKGDAHGPDAVASCHVDFNPRIGTPQGHLLIQRWRRPSPGVLHLLPGLTPGRADQEVIGNGNLRRFDLEPGVLKRNPDWILSSSTLISFRASGVLCRRRMR